MAIDILNIKPNSVSTDLASKFILIFGESKCGKTSFAAQIPNSLLLAFEKGYHALDGVMAQDVNRWSDFKLILRQLDTPEAHEMYKCVIIDTAPIAYEECEQFICGQNGVTKIGDIPYGGGYSATKKEFESAFRKLSQMCYGIVFISHAEKRKITDSKNNELEILSPDLPKRAAEVIEPMVDIIGMIDCVVHEDGTSERWLYTRKTPTIKAGSRWKYLDAKIPFGYTELINALDRAIKKEVELGASVTDEKISIVGQDLNYADLRKEAEQLWKELIAKDKNNSRIILQKAEEIFGFPIRLSEITPIQVEPYSILVAEMRELNK